MKLAQSGILADETKLARYLTFKISDENKIKNTLRALADFANMENTVIGFGVTICDKIEGMRNMPFLAGAGVENPSTPQSLWVWLRGNDRGEIYHRSREIEAVLSSAFSLTSTIDSFQFDENRDLSGYIDGTENPDGEDAINAAVVQNAGEGLDGSSFVAVQQWLHDFDELSQMSETEKDDAIGRHISNNEEYDAPASAHVKRSAQEDFEPEAFILRRSMPWVDGMTGGLMFVAFGHSFDAFEAILKRMMGMDDEIVDALYKFTKPITGAYFWCPPVKNGKLDLSALGSDFAK